MKIRLFFICLSVFLISVSGSLIHAQSNFLNIKNVDGSSKAIALSSLDKITFSETKIVVNYTSGELENYDISLVQKILFSESAESNIEDLSKQEKLSLYPNPSSDYVCISTGKNIAESVVFYSVSGCEVLRVSNYIEGSKISVKSLSRGIYLVKTKNMALKFSKL